ncbi:hypothetical protein EU537_09425 [Candidatus Thorarchaeota archaeon]|nr:MAG: hypothetical protein EU537_09425 [Candidatus Thorarchaeota archaeon]
MRNRKTAASAIIILSVIGITAILLWQWTLAPPEPDPLPAPPRAPGYIVNPVQVQDLQMNAIMDNLRGAIGHEGYYHLGFDLTVNVSNLGASDITDFDTVKATLFRQNLSIIYTFDLSYRKNRTVQAESRNLFLYEIHSKFVPRGRFRAYEEDLFLRVLVTFDGSNEAIVTTPLTPIRVAIA